MLVITSVQYTISVIAYASSDCERIYQCSSCLSLSCGKWHITGLILGMSVAWTVKNYLPNLDWSYLVLNLIDIMVLTKHSLHCCLRIARKSKRRGRGLLGNQVFPTHNGNTNILGLCLNILDSIPARILLYGLFTILPVW